MADLRKKAHKSLFTEDILRFLSECIIKVLQYKLGGADARPCHFCIVPCEFIPVQVCYFRHLASQRLGRKAEHLDAFFCKMSITRKTRFFGNFGDALSCVAEQLDRLHQAQLHNDVMIRHTGNFTKILRESASGHHRSLCGIVDKPFLRIGIFDFYYRLS